MNQECDSPLSQGQGIDRSGCARSGEAGFTLIEMLVVIAIIAILVSLLTVATTNVLWISKRRATESLIEKIDNGLKAYKQDFTDVPRSGMTVQIVKGGTPTTFSDSNNAALLHAVLGAKLRAVHTRDPVKNQTHWKTKEPYLSLSKDDVKSREIHNYHKPFVDAWQRELNVEFRPSPSPSCGSRDLTDFAAIWSEGAEVEGSDGCGEDDINNFGDKYVQKKN